MAFKSVGMRKMQKIIKIILSIPNTLIFNFKCFPLREAMILPVIVSYNVKMRNLRKGAVHIHGPVSTGMISIGVAEGTNGIQEMKGRGYILFGKNSGNITFRGKAQLAKGISLNVDTGKIIFGKGFTCNKYCFIASAKQIDFGDDVMLGPYTTIRDMDGHNIYNLKDEKKEHPINSASEIKIGNHVWTGAYASILKGCDVADGCIIAFGACVTKSFQEKNCVVGGVPGIIIKREIVWQR